MVRTKDTDISKMVDKILIKFLLDLKRFYEKGKIQAKKDRKEKLIPKFDFLINEIENLIQKYKKE